MSTTSTTRPRVPTRVVAAGILVVALVLAGIVSFYAASTPDGLTKVSIDQGFADTETDHGTAEGPFAGYSATFVGDERASGGLAGVVGVVVVLVLAGGLTLALRRREDAPDPAPTADTTV